MAQTIAAISTAPMKSALGIIRISGDDALSVAERVFCGRLSQSPREMVTGKFLSQTGDTLDFGMAVYFKGPKSFTGEDSVEFFCHGSTAVLSAVLSSLFKAGAHPAKPGEFSERAFLNGKIDLTQAEAIIDLIDSDCELAAKNAAEQMNGAMGREISSISDSLTAIAAEFYAYVDYPDDDIPETERDELCKSLALCAQKAKGLSGTYERGKLLRDGVKVALVGRPNVGKSSLLNAILGTDRSIVTDIEGTTRDTVEESFSINSLTLHLIDTAGLREAEGEPERLGIERSRRAIDSSDLVIAVFDGSVPLDSYDREILSIAEKKRSICVINKNDLGCVLSADNFSPLPTVVLSAKENKGTDELLALICKTVGASDIPCDGRTVTNPRHASTLMRAHDAIVSAAEGFKNGTYPDLCVTDIENAINILGEITGNCAQDVIISEIFSRFCVGK
ncbi:MAG: tRNA uridine-5-carboxymethylaminomethyl(34) synthesis GTPase MnmE [Oscillospiraceae bacterium]|nr:tRNA uridine-5-carboxymethylaminomethyl(34) synthesis GTPase MnmE [Oscillospiraceae bacterium]